MSALALAVVLFAAPTPSPTPAATATPASSLDAPIPTPALAPTPSPAATAAPKRIAVVATGDDAFAAGELQRELEKRLAATVTGYTIRPTADVALRIGAPKAAAPSPTPDPAAAALLEQAIGAYYDAQYVKALDLFAQTQGLNENTDAPVSRRTEVLLWRVAVFLGLNDLTQAQTEALAALTLNPELKVDPSSEIPPSVSQQLDKVRTSPTFKLLTVIVNGLPATASLSVDGRLVPSRFKVLAGRHKIVASSNNRRDVTREVDITADTAVTISLPPALPPELEPVVTAFAQADKKALEPAEIATLAQKLDAEWVVFATTVGGQATAILRRSVNGELTPAGPFPGAEAPAAIATALAKPIKNAKDVKGGPAGQPYVYDDTEWTVTSHGTLLASGWLRSISAGGDDVQTFFGGAGPELRVEAVKGSMLLAASGSFVSYDASSVEVKLPDGSKTSATGGSTMRVVAGGGWRGGGPDRRRFRALAMLDIENHGNSDPKNGGATLNLITGYTRAAFELRGGFRMAAPALPAYLLDLELGVSPYAYFAEAPSGASGDSPSSGPAVLWAAGLERAPSATSRWGYRLTYTGEMRSVTFKGQSEAAVNPPMRDATLDEMFHALSLTATRRF